MTALLIPRHVIVIDSTLIPGIADDDARNWLQRWIKSARGVKRGDLRVVPCASSAEVARVEIMLVRRGLPEEAIVRDGAS